MAIYRTTTVRRPIANPAAYFSAARFGLAGSGPATRNRAATIIQRIARGRIARTGGLDRIATRLRQRRQMPMVNRYLTLSRQQNATGRLLRGITRAGLGRQVFKYF